jgi:hypothetical protein
MTVRTTISSAVRGAMVLLAFTGAGVGVAFADPSPVTHKNWVDDPYTPHVTDGHLLRFGTAVGPVRVDDRHYTGIGPTIAFGHRQGRFSFDGEFTELLLQAPGTGSIELGAAHQFAAIARFEPLRFGPHMVGGNSLLSIYGEGGLVRTIYQYFQPSLSEAPRAVPQNNSRSQVEVGMGLLLDHRLEQPLGFPNRIGWQLGWRLVTSPRATRDTMVACRGCIAAPVPAASSQHVDTYDTEMLLTSTLDFTW